MFRRRATFMHRLVTEQRHTEHQPKHLITGQTPSTYGCLRGKTQRGFHPPDRDVLSKGTQIGKVEQVAQIEQMLLESHKKSDARVLASDCRETAR